MEATRKRQRANTNGDIVPPQQTNIDAGSTAASATISAVPQCDLSDCIETLDAANNGATIKRLLLTLAQSGPVAANLVRHSYDSHIRREQSKVIDFDPYSKHVW
jgi:hypothetical protein